MKQKGSIRIWSGLLTVLLLTALLTGCAASDQPAVTAPAPTVPALQPNLGADWGDEQGQSFPGSPAYTLPAIDGTPGDGMGEAPTAGTWSWEEQDPEQKPEPTQPIQQRPDSGENLSPLTPVHPSEGSTQPISEPSPLEKLLVSELEGLDGTWSIYVKNLDTGEEVCINDEPMVAASLIKLFVAGAYYATDPKAENTQRCSQVDRMIRVSSNEDCNALIDLLGKDGINRFIRDQGFRDSELNRKMLEAVDTENYTSARECGLVLEAILKGEYVSKEASERLLKNLLDQERTWKIPAGVPEGVETANKTGELSDTENDACIVWSSGGTYIICVLANDQSNVYTAREKIVDISALVYDYFTKQTNGTASAPGH